MERGPFSFALSTNISSFCIFTSIHFEGKGGFVNILNKIGKLKIGFKIVIKNTLLTLSWCTHFSLSSSSACKSHNI
jgi:hypothetical protein